MTLPARQNITLLGGLLFLAAQTAMSAQDRSPADILPGLRERAVVLDIVARVVEPNQEEVWNSSNSRVTIPGRPVSLKLVGANVVVAVQFTPYLRHNGPNFLVAQGQIWVEVPGQGIHYQTTMQTIPLEFGEQIYFFPLGSISSQGDAYIEILLKLYPYQTGGEGEGEGEDSPGEIPPPDEGGGGGKAESPPPETESLP